MVVLIDTNIIVDFFMTREPFFEASSEIMKMCASKELEGYIAFHSVSNLWYILRKIPENRRREWLIDMLGFLKVIGVEHGEVIKALKMVEFKDFEDCLQDRCAKSIGAMYIITRNTMDFSKSDIPAITPEAFLSTASE